MKMLAAIAAISLSAALAGMTVTSPPAAAKARTSCKLKGKGRTVYVNGEMRVIKRRFREDGEEGFKLVACARRVGKNRTLGVSAGRSDVMFKSAAGTFVAVTRTEEDPVHYSDETLVINVRTGRSYSVASSSYARDDYAARFTSVRKIRLDRSGRSAASLISGPGGSSGSFVDRVEIRAFPASRVARVLDSGTPAQIDPNSVRLQAGIAYWTREGRERQAAL